MLHTVHHTILVWHVVFWIALAVLCLEIIADRPILKTVRWLRGLKR